MRPKESFLSKIKILVPSPQPQQRGEVVQSLPEKNSVTHAILTCWDDRINALVDQEVRSIRANGGIIQDKAINRLPGGVHMLAGKTDCRKAFYEMIDGLVRIAKIQVLHLWPHTNCQYCGLHFQEKLGTGSKSDLRFHLRSAEKMLAGAMSHLAGNPMDHVPELDVRIILTNDQEIITIDDAHKLLPNVPEHGHHGAPCIGIHEHQGHTSPAHGSHGNGHDIHPLS